MAGKKLSTLPFTMTSWEWWKKKHPETLVLSTKTGYSRDYSRDPYEDYYKNPFSFFRTKRKPPLLPEKTLIFGIELDGAKRAYPMEKLRNLEAPLKDKLKGHEVTIRWDRESGEIAASDAGGNDLPGLITYWFVWYKFHPHSTVYGKR